MEYRSFVAEVAASLPDYFHADIRAFKILVSGFENLKYKCVVQPIVFHIKKSNLFPKIFRKTIFLFGDPEKNASSNMLV